MKPVFQRTLFILAGVFVILQFVRPPKNIAAGPSPSDFMVKYPPPAEVRQILSTACYDCHSNTTRYPWYANIQPAGWWLKQHVDDGKTELNFSEFADYTTKRKRQKLETASDEVRDKSMPLPSYLWIHHDARLTPEQTKALMDWFDKVLEKVEDEG